MCLFTSHSSSNVCIVVLSKLAFVLFCAPLLSPLPCRAGGTAPVGQAMARPTFKLVLVKIFCKKFLKKFCKKIIMITKKKLWTIN